MKLLLTVWLTIIIGLVYAIIQHVWKNYQVEQHDKQENVSRKFPLIRWLDHFIKMKVHEASIYYGTGTIRPINKLNTSYLDGMNEYEFVEYMRHHLESQGVECASFIFIDEDNDAHSYPFLIFKDRGDYYFVLKSIEGYEDLYGPYVDRYNAIMSITQILIAQYMWEHIRTIRYDKFECANMNYKDYFEKVVSLEKNTCETSYFASHLSNGVFMIHGGPERNDNDSSAI